MEVEVNKLDVEAKAELDETKERSVHICKLDRFNYSIASVISDLRHVTDALYPPRAVNAAHNKTLQNSALVYLNRAMVAVP